MSSRRVTFAIDFENDQIKRVHPPSVEYSHPQYARATSSSCCGASAESVLARKSLRELCAYCEHLNTRTYREDWTPEIFRKLSVHVQELHKYIHYVMQPWFVDKHDMVFKKLLHNVKDAIGLYANRLVFTTGTISVSELHFINTVHDNITVPLEKMREKAKIRKYKHRYFSL